MAYVVSNRRSGISLADLFANISVNVKAALARRAIYSRTLAELSQGLEISRGPLDLPLLDQGLGGIACQVREVWRPGDHALVLGEVAGLEWWGGAEAMAAVETGHPYLGLA